MALRKRTPKTQGRELLFFGAVRQGFEKARGGLEEAKSAIQELSQDDPENVRVQRMLARLERCLEEVHTLNVKAGRVRVNQGVLV